MLTITKVKELIDSAHTEAVKCDIVSTYFRGILDYLVDYSAGRLESDTDLAYVLLGWSVYWATPDHKPIGLKDSRRPSIDREDPELRDVVAELADAFGITSEEIACARATRREP